MQTQLNVYEENKKAEILVYGLNMRIVNRIICNLEECADLKKKIEMNYGVAKVDIQKVLS